MRKFKRVFLIVMDSVGIGYAEDAERFGDKGSDTFVHTAEKCGGLKIPNLNYLGIGDLTPALGTQKLPHPHSYVLKLHEASKGKDTLTGHCEMMGIMTEKPLITFTDTGFPKELMDQLAEKTGRKLLGNYSASGTEILKELGEQAMKEKALIVYTSADSVLQIAAHVGVIPLEDLYKYCEIARELTMKPEWKVGRVIARPFLGDNKDNFYRTTDRHDYALNPSGRTAMNDLQDNKLDVIAVGKIHDIFNGVGCTKSIHTVSNHNGMEITTDIAKNEDFTGLCFVNLVEFDSSYGHRRNPTGYGACIEEFDRDIKVFIDNMKNDDLLMITADHGNDPTWTGTDHTRENVPLICYSKLFKDGIRLKDQNSFACIGKTILKNFGIKPSPNQIGDVINEIL